MDGAAEPMSGQRPLVGEDVSHEAAPLRLAAGITLPRPLGKSGCLRPLGISGPNRRVMGVAPAHEPCKLARRRGVAHASTTCSSATNAVSAHKTTGHIANGEWQRRTGGDGSDGGGGARGDVLLTLSRVAGARALS